MKFLSKVAIATALGAAASATTLQTSALAFSVTQNSDPTALKNALLGETPNLSNFNFTFTGDARAFGTFQNDPFGIGSGVVLSTGDVTQLPGINSGDQFLNADLNTSFSVTPSSPDIYDLAQIDITFFANSLAEKVFFKYVFGSEEFVEYGGSLYNDSMQLLLNGENLAKLNDGQLVTVNNLVPSPTGPFNADYINNPVGAGAAASVTRLDGYTKELTFEGLLNKNATNTLSIRLWDTRDARLDSALFLKGGSISSLPPDPEPSPAVPEPTTMAGVFMGGSLLAAAKRLRQQQAANKAKV
jgi:hypothetical protein